MKIHIFYRHYNTDSLKNSSYRPEGFSYEKSFNNLLETITEYPNIELTVMMDGSKQGTFLEKYNVEVYEFKGGSDSVSFFETVKYAKNKNIRDNDLIYFLENDYLHLYGWVDKVMDLFSAFKNLSYVSLYDHNDKYFLPMYQDLVSQIITTKTHHWRTTPSTCGSFIIPKRILDEDFDILSTVVGDHNKFLGLNANKGRIVITPIPGLSTHCMEGLMSPTINWEKINNI
jgi:hypothetical protein